MEPEPGLLLRCGRLFHPQRLELWGRADVLVKDGTIASVAPRIATGDARVVDLRDCTLLPGLIDLDAGLLSDQVSGDTGMWLYEALAASRDLLRRGITTARVPGGADKRWSLLDLRRAIAEELAPGAELLVAPHLLDDELSAAQIGRAVERERRNGADWIAVDRRGVTADELRAVVDSAAGLPVAVAAQTAAEIMVANDAAVRSAEVSCELDAGTAAAVAKGSTYLVPRDGFGAPDAVGLRLAFGGRLTGGLAQLAELTGAAPALAAATVTAAACASLSDRGTIEPGKRADLIAVGGDPIADIALLGNPSVVIKQGRLQR
ncbi:MAG TPA: amidohydrolase family protein [Baekduia sp.]|nr:amidohydrolase family protein [Baekduia sp.]